jgi:predicted metal-binding membrane protein
MHDSSVLESVLERDRTIVIAGLVTVIVLSWIYILLGAGMSMTAFEMTTMSMPGSSSQMDMAGDSNGRSAQKGMGGTMRMAHAAMMRPTVWTPSYAVLMFFMWWIMMVAMMLPSASPMVLLFARIQRSQKVKGAPFVSTSIFAMGYLVSPLQFITHHWRHGTFGAFRMGIDHGAFCLACCWFLMALLFVGGVMNLYWIVGLAVFVLLEKTIPAGHWLGSLTGIGLIVWGGWLVAGTLL